MTRAIFYLAGPPGRDDEFFNEHPELEEENYKEEY